MHKIILSLLILLISTIGLSQGKTDEQQKTNSRKQLKIAAEQKIKEMYNGVLLVRLKTRKKSIAALRSSGRDAKADKIERKQAEFNTEIINGFKANFDFCPTYFFYSDYSQAALDGQFDKVEFLNDSLQYDSTITFNNKIIYTAEFGIIEQDSVQFFDDYYYEAGEEVGLQKRKQYNGGANMSFGALIIKSDQFIQLRKPFPYYSRTLGSVPIKRKPELVIAEMNSQLHRFYKKN